MEEKHDMTLRRKLTCHIVINTILVFFIVTTPLTYLSYAYPDYLYYDFWITPHFNEYTVTQDVTVSEYSHMINNREQHSNNNEPLFISEGSTVTGYYSSEGVFIATYNCGQHDSYEFELNGDVVTTSDGSADISLEAYEHNQIIAQRNERYSGFLKTLNEYAFIPFLAGSLFAAVFFFTDFLVLQKKSKQNPPIRNPYRTFILVNSILTIALIVLGIFLLSNPTFFL